MAIPGLPDRENYGDLSKLSPGDLVSYVIQQHQAERAGKHYDLRFGTPEKGLFSWATKKGVPPPGKPMALFQQPLHSWDYKDFEGNIPSGYGKGSVRKLHEGELLLTRSSPNTLSFTVASGKNPERFVLVRPDKKDVPWLLVRSSPPQSTGAEKPRYTAIPSEEIEPTLKNLSPGATVQPKVDGALQFVQLLKDRVELMSHRTSKTTGNPIAHTERFFGQIPQIDVPKKHQGEVLLGEMYGERGGSAIPPQELGGILNSSISKSLHKQKDQGVNLKTVLFDVANHPDKTYPQRMQLLKDIVQKLPPEKFQLPESSQDPEGALKMFHKIRSTKHPVTQEGVVIHPETGPGMKGKITNEQDVTIRNVFPGEGKYEGNAYGGFNYSLFPQGPVVGRVGTGISDELRRNLKDYVSRTARVRSTGSFPSGALRAPSLIAIHEDR